MARDLVIRGVRVKTRSPLVAALLSLVTLGIYYYAWYFQINRELNDYGARFPSNPLKVNPGVALLAVSLGGFLIIPPFVSMWRTFARIRRAQKLAGMEDMASHVLGFFLFLLALVLLPFEVAYAQRHLNRLWERVADEEQKERLGMRGRPATSYA